MNNTNAMRTVKAGMMPGRLVEVAVEDVTTVGQVFELSGIEIPTGYEVRMDGEKVEMSKRATGNLIVASKMIKGNATIKVGTMPGRLVEVAVEGTETVAQVFEIAGIEILSGYELRADGTKVDASQSVSGANLVVQSKMIKGNNSTKVGLMPGRLVEILAEDGMTVAQRFELAGVSVPSGYEVRADGEKVELSDTRVANLLVASKMIKGNCESNDFDCADCVCQRICGMNF